MAKLKFSPKEAIAEAANNVLKLFMIANGSDEKTATMFGGTLSGIIKGFSIEKRQSIRKGLDTAIKNAWVEILSKEEFEGLEEKCITDLKKNVISSLTVFEALSTDNPEVELQAKIKTILSSYTDWNYIDLNDYARFVAEQLLNTINKEIEVDGILTLLQEIEKVHKEIYAKIKTLEEVDLVLNQKVIKKLDAIWAIVSLSEERNNAFPLTSERFWNAGKLWYEEARKPGARFHSLDIVNHILPSAENKPAESEYRFPFRATDTNENTIQCSRFSELLQDKSSIYHQGHFMLIGEGGIGKTTTLMSAMQDAYEKKEEYTGESVIPLFVELSMAPDSQDSHAYDGTSSSVIHRLIYAMLQRKDRKKDYSNLLRECMNDEKSIAKDTVRELLASATDDETRYVLLIDGLNEVSPEPFTGRSSSAQQRILQEIKEMIVKYPNVTIILTGRQGANIDHSSFHPFYLRGLVWEEIEDYLRRKGKTDYEISLIRTGDKGLLNVLSIPMFLTMFVHLRDTKGITTRGELLKVFFHERFECRKNEYALHRQGDISERIDQDEEQSISGKMTRGNITLHIQWMFLDVLIPEIAAKMERLHDFRISEKNVRSLLESLFKDQDSLYCGNYKEFSNICFAEQMQGEDLEDVVSDFTEAYRQKAARYSSAFLRYCQSSMGILYREGEKSYGFVHQHLRDYFAAVCNVNRMKIAYIALQEGDIVSARTVMQQYNKEPINPVLMIYIGEYLGEHHNAPQYSEVAEVPYEAGITEESFRERQLINSEFNIYRGMDQKNAYGVYNLIGILKRVRKDLSGSDFHDLDLRQCHFYNVPLDSIPDTNFSDALVDANNWFAQGHTSVVNTAFFSQDGSLIVTASDDHTARVWNRFTGHLNCTLMGHSGRVKYANFSADGRHVITVSDDGTARIWESQTGILTSNLEVHSSAVTSAYFSSDGNQVIIASFDGFVRIWNTRTKEYTSSFRINGAYILSGERVGISVDCMSISPDGSCVVTASASVIQIWDSNSGVLQRTLDASYGWVNTVSFSPDGKYIVTSFHTGVAGIWDIHTGLIKHIFIGHSEEVNTASFSPDGNQIITSSDDGTARIWDSYSGNLIHILKGHSDKVNTASFSPDGSLAITTSADQTVKIWDCKTGILKYSLERLTFASFSSDGNLIVTVSDDREHPVIIWNSGTGTIHQTLEGNLWQVNSISISIDGKTIVTGSNKGMVRIWDGDTCVVSRTIEDYVGDVSTTNISQDGNFIVTAFRDGTAHIWNTNTGILQSTLNGHYGWVNTANFSPDGSLIVTASKDGTAKVWDIKTGALRHTLKGHFGGVNTAKYNQDGSKIITTSDDMTVRIWDNNTGILLHTLEGNFGKVFAASFTSSKSLIVTVSMGLKAQIRDGETGTLLYELRGDHGLVNTVDFTLNGIYIVTVSDDGRVQIWDSTTGTLLKTFMEPKGQIACTCFNPDGSLLAVAFRDGTIRIWNIRTGDVIKTLYEEPGLHIHGVNFKDINSQSKMTDKQRAIFHQHGAIV